MSMLSRQTQLLDSITHSHLGAGNRLRSAGRWLLAEARVSAPEVS